MSKKQVIQKESFLETLLRWSIVGVFAVLPLLYFSGRIASYVTSKQYFLMGTIELMTVLWVWLLIADKRYRLTRNMMIFLSPLFIFLVVSTISAFAGVDTATSFFSTVETGTGLVLFYHIFLFVCIIATFLRVRQERLLKGIFQATFFASIVVAIMTFFTGPNGLRNIGSEMLNRSSGGATVGNSLLAGAYFIFSLFFTLVLISKENQTWKKIMYWIGIALILICPIFFNVAIFKGEEFSSALFFFGQARIAEAALFVGVLVSLGVWMIAQKENKTLKNIGVAAIAILLLGGIVGIYQLATPNNRFNTFFVKESGNRLVDWNAAVEGFKDKPLLGWGAENFRVVYQKYLDPIVYDPGRGNEGWSLHPHSNVLEILVNGGIIGFISYITFLGFLFFGLFKLYRNDRIDSKTFALLTGMLVAFILQQQMVYDSITSYTMLFSMAGIITGLLYTTDERRSIAKDTPGWIYATATVFTVVMVPLWVYTAYLPARKMEEVLTLATMPSDQRVLKYEHLFHSSGAYAIQTDPEFFTESIFFSYADQKEMIRDNPVYKEIASKELRSLINTVKPIADNSPYNYHLNLNLMQLENLMFYLTGDEAALKINDTYAKKGFSLSTTNPDIYHAYAQTLVYENKIPEARALLIKGHALNENYEPINDFIQKLDAQYGNR